MVAIHLSGRVGPLELDGSRLRVLPMPWAQPCQIVGADLCVFPDFHDGFLAHAEISTMDGVVCALNDLCYTGDGAWQWRSTHLQGADPPMHFHGDLRVLLTMQPELEGAAYGLTVYVLPG